jgi:hypothetical protein
MVIKKCCCVFSSTPKAERQSFTTPLPASPVASEQKFPRDDASLLQSQQASCPQERDTRPDTVCGIDFE